MVQGTCYFPFDFRPTAWADPAGLEKNGSHTDENQREPIR
jgi:hypothetical protein